MLTGCYLLYVLVSDGIADTHCGTIQCLFSQCLATRHHRSARTCLTHRNFALLPRVEQQMRRSPRAKDLSLRNTWVALTALARGHGVGDFVNLRRPRVREVLRSFRSEKCSAIFPVYNMSLWALTYLHTCLLK